MLRNNVKKVSVITPTFNVWSETRQFLNSLRKVNYPKNKLEVIIVDNNSTDNTVSDIKKNYPEVKLFTLEKNSGFAVAVNIGIRNATGDYILVSSNDVIFDKNYFKNLAEQADKEPHLGIMSALVYLKKPRNKLAFDGFKVNPYLGYHQYDLNGLDKPRECEFISGNGLFVPKKVFKKVGLLDEGFFIYFEDLDFCLRVRRQGYRLVYNPKAIAYHGYGKTQFKKGAEEVVTQGYVSKWRCIFKNATIPQIFTSIIAQFTILIIAQNLRSKNKTYKSLFKGFFWNLKNLNQTLEARKGVRANLHSQKVVNYFKKL